MYAITRGKAAKAAWYWAVHIRRRGELRYRRFYDLKRGGSKKALAAAVRWRNRLLRRLPPLSIREFHEQLRSNNTSGVPGVHFLRPKRQPRGIWQASIKIGGKMVHRTYSVARLGEREAFRQAVAARRQLLELVGGGLYLKDRTARACTETRRLRETIAPRTL